MQPLEQQDPASGTNLLKLNELGGTFMAVALILCTVGFITTVTLMALNKGGKLGNFNPWRVLTPVWAAILIMSLPGIIHFGSTLFPKPPISQAEAVTPAYKNEGGGTGTITSRDKARELIAPEEIDAVAETKLAGFKELTYHKTGDGTLDPCVKVKVTFANEMAKGQEYFTPASYSESTCGGPVKEWTE